MKLKRTETQIAAQQFRSRGYWVVGALVLCGLGILARAIDLQVLKHGFLAEQGAERFMRNARIPAHRGSVTDRFGEPLAVSTPVDTVWANASEVNTAPEKLPMLAKVLQRDPDWLTRRITSNLESQYLVLAKQLQPDGRCVAENAIGEHDVGTAVTHRG
jgi:cell division protein FtsI (penicillin-binding protein 3)